MFKTMRVVILFDMLLNSSFKLMTSFTNVARTTASTIKFIYEERFQIYIWIYIENIKSNLNKNACLPFLINKVIKKYLDYKFTGNQNQLKVTNLMFITLNYHISTTFHTTSKVNFQNFAKSFLKKILTLI